MEAINHEYYVSLEVAKLLKEAGFDWECQYYIHAYTQEIVDSIKAHKKLYRNEDVDFSSPTLEVAQRWLREVKNIFIEVTRYETIHPLARELIEAIYDETVDKSFAYGVNVLDVNNESIYDGDCFLTYEESLEAGIKKALEIILEKGE